MHPLKLLLLCLLGLCDPARAVIRVTTVAKVLCCLEQNVVTVSRYNRCHARDFPFESISVTGLGPDDLVRVFSRRVGQSYCSGELRTGRGDRNGTWGASIRQGTGFDIIRAPRKQKEPVLPPVEAKGVGVLNPDDSPAYALPEADHRPWLAANDPSSQGTSAQDARFNDENENDGDPSSFSSSSSLDADAYSPPVQQNGFERLMSCADARRLGIDPCSQGGFPSSSSPSDPEDVAGPSRPWSMEDEAGPSRPWSI
ncbi:MAG: hypothetical protein M1825_001092 [Sarcosagium campestre]|nr:MAG: hypothetical protein M1825_001092 [Sarcosagium campestre]